MWCRTDSTSWISIDVNLKFTLANLLRVFNMVWGTLSSPSYVDIYRENGMPFSAIVFPLFNYKGVKDLYRDKMLCCATLHSADRECPPCLFHKEVVTISLKVTESRKMPPFRNMHAQSLSKLKTFFLNW